MAKPDNSWVNAPGNVAWRGFARKWTYTTCIVVLVYCPLFFVARWLVAETMPGLNHGRFWLSYFAWQLTTLTFIGISLAGFVLVGPFVYIRCGASLVVSRTLILGLPIVIGVILPAALFMLFYTRGPLGVARTIRDLGMMLGLVAILFGVATMLFVFISWIAGIVRRTHV